MEVRRVDRDDVLEYHLTLRGAPGVSAAEDAVRMYREIARMLAAERVQVLQEKAYGPAAARDAVLDVRRTCLARAGLDPATPCTYVEGHAGRMGHNRGRFAYFVHPGLPSGMIELSEMTGGKAEYFEKVRQAAAGWDGADPIRTVPSR